MIITDIICLAKKNGVAKTMQKQGVHIFKFCPQKIYPTNIHTFIFLIAFVHTENDKNVLEVYVIITSCLIENRGMDK